MIKYLLPIAAIMFSVTFASADGYGAHTSVHTGVVVNVNPVYGTVYTPNVQQQCVQVQVPVYGNTYGGAGDALAGAIIGGAIGNQFGSGSGQEAATILGAILGANRATYNSRGVVGYTYEQRCDTIHVEQEVRTIHHYEITYRMNGVHYTVTSVRTFDIGQHITVNY